MANKRPPLGQRQQQEAEEVGGSGSGGRSIGPAAVRKHAAEELSNMGNGVGGGLGVPSSSSRRGSAALDEGGEGGSGGAVFRAAKPPRGMSPAGSMRKSPADRLAETLSATAGMRRPSPSSRGMSPSSGSRGASPSSARRRGSLSKTMTVLDDADVMSMRLGTGKTDAVAPDEHQQLPQQPRSRATSASSSLRAKRQATQLEEEEDADGNSTPVKEDMVLQAASGMLLEKLTSIVLSGQFISSIACLKSCPQLRSLDLSHNRLRIVEGLDGLPHLRELRLSYNRLWTLSGINKNGALEELYANMNRLEEIGKGWFSAHKKLKVLRLDGNNVRRLCNLDALASLTHLDVGNNSLQKVEGLGMLAQMEVLCLSNNGISSISGLDGAAWLREVDLSSNRLTSLSGLKSVGKLEVLRLDRNAISDVSSMPRLGGLLELYLDDNEIEGGCGKAVASRCPQLEFLSLSNNNIKDLSEIRHFGGISCLIDLKIAGNPVCDKREFENMVREHCTQIDTIDGEVLRERGTVEDDDEVDASERVIKAGGEGSNRAPQRQKKELSDVLPLEYFDDQMREVREGIQRVREGVTGELLAVSKANDPTFAPVTVGVGSAAAKAAAARGVETPSSYSKGDAAVDAALSRVRAQRKNGPSIKELMQREERRRLGIEEAAEAEGAGQKVGVKELARSDYLMSKQLEGRDGEEKEKEKEKEEKREKVAAERSGGAGGRGIAAGIGGRGGGVGEAGDGGGVPDVIRKANAEIEKLLKFANANIEDELKAEDDEKNRADKVQAQPESLKEIMQRIAFERPANTQQHPDDSPPVSPGARGGRDAGGGTDWAKALADDSRPGTSASCVAGVGLPAAVPVHAAHGVPNGGSQSARGAPRGDDAVSFGADGSQSARGNDASEGDWAAVSRGPSRPGTSSRGGGAGISGSRPGTSSGGGRPMSRPGTSGGGSRPGTSASSSRPGTSGSSRVRDRISEAKQFSESTEFGAGDLGGGDTPSS